MRGPKIVLAYVLVAWAAAAIAGKYHFGYGMTQKEAMVDATEQARAEAARRRTCYRPAWVVNDCRVEQAIHFCPFVGPCVGRPGLQYTCRAESADQWGSCGRNGYLSAGDYAPPRIPEFPIYPLPRLPEGPKPINHPCNSDEGPPCDPKPKQQ